MPRKRHTGVRLADATSLPTFEACELKSAAGWYVRISWRYGQVEHISGFASAHDAERWISEKSPGWMRNRSAALRGG